MCALGAETQESSTGCNAAIHNHTSTLSIPEVQEVQGGLCQAARAERPGRKDRDQRPETHSERHSDTARKGAASKRAAHPDTAVCGIRPGQPRNAGRGVAAVLGGAGRALGGRALGGGES